MIMQEWSQPGAGRATDPEPERDPARTVPDRPEPPDSEESADWDELTPVGTGQVTPPADVLVAGAPLAEPGLRPGAGPAERAAPPVELADEVLRSVTDALAARKQTLDDHWRTRRDAPSDTERFRLAVRAYREFID